MTQSEYCIKSKQHSSNHDIDFDMDDDDDLDDDEYDEEYSSSGKCQKSWTHIAEPISPAHKHCTNRLNTFLVFCQGREVHFVEEM